MSDTLQLSIEALSDLVGFQRAIIKDLKYKLDQVRLHADTLDSYEIAILAQQRGDQMQMVPVQLIKDLREALK